MNFPTDIPASAPPSFVLDVSVGASWGIPMRYTVYAHSVQSRLAFGADAIVATNWPLDLLDELLAAVNRGERTHRRADAVLANLPTYRIYLDSESPHRAWPEALDLARTYGISARDAACLELCLRRNLPLATTDAAFAARASAAGVPIFTP
jgi:predicted nucleic acid-binding protein